MIEKYLNKSVVVIVSDSETVRGVLTKIIDEDFFEVTNSTGKPSIWNIKQIKGIKSKEEI